MGGPSTDRSDSVCLCTVQTITVVKAGGPSTDRSDSVCLCTVQTITVVKVGGFSSDSVCLCTLQPITVVKAGGPLGLSIVGGLDHTSHPFGVDEPGIFISKVDILIVYFMLKLLTISKSQF